LDAEIFFRFFNDNDTSNPDRDTAIIVSLEGRMYPVDVHYLMEPCSHYVNKTVETIFQIHEKVSMILILNKIHSRINKDWLRMRIKIFAPSDL